MAWCNYEYAWGGRYTHFYKEQNLNGCAILEHELQPIRFQGQFFDTETSLHYNRFRYYDTDVGMFIQRDPIGLLGGINIYQYADNPVQFIDPFGLARKPSQILDKALGGKNTIDFKLIISYLLKYGQNIMIFLQVLVWRMIEIRHQMDC